MSRKHDPIGWLLKRMGPLLLWDLTVPLTVVIACIALGYIIAVVIARVIG
jgi:hypothetical protein